MTTDNEVCRVFDVEFVKATGERVSAGRIEIAGGDYEDLREVQAHDEAVLKLRNLPDLGLIAFEGFMLKREDFDHIEVRLSSITRPPIPEAEPA